MTHRGSNSRTGIDSRSASNSAPRFWKPGTPAPGVNNISEERTSTSDQTGLDNASVIYNPYRDLSIEQQRQKLPVFQYRNHILYLAEKYQTVVIIGETGCGKSTQIPQYLLEAGWALNGYIIGVTQPRRVAAVTVATRVAEERGAILGDEVGYLIRFDNCCDDQRTRVKFMTDGMMITEIMKDPLLRKYRPTLKDKGGVCYILQGVEDKSGPIDKSKVASVLLIDEAHERALNTDIILGLLRKIQKKRKDLRIIVASATLNAEEMKNFFNTNETDDIEKDTAVIMTVQGREYPVDIHYMLDPVPNYIKASVETVMKIHFKEGPGDIIVFLTGMHEVDDVVSQLISKARNLSKDDMRMKVLPMHGSLPSSEQMKVFERTPKNTRKIVVSTNIAEASITVPGIAYIVDSGFVKLKAYNPKSGIESLVITPISQASANQRAGRAGRVRAGKAYRLYTEESYRNLPTSAVPDMLRSDLAPVILQLKALGISNVLRFHFISPPPAQNMVRGLELLYALGALDDSGNLTSPLGLQMAEFPLSPSFAKMLLSSGDFGCSEEAIIVCAMTQIQNVFVTPSNRKAASEQERRKFSVMEGDHLTLINVYKAFIKYGQNSKWCHEHCLNYKGLIRAVEISNQLGRLLSRSKVKIISCEENTVSLRKCILSGFFANAAKLHYTGEYRTIRDDHTLHIHPTSVLACEEPPQWVVFNEVVQTNKDYMRDITVIQPEWLCELAPHFYQFGTEREIAAKRARLE